MNRFGMILFCGLLTGCGLVEAYVDGVSNIFKTDSQRLDELVPRLDSRLGQSKDAHIKRKGLPSGCTTLTTGEEVCEWRRGGATSPTMNCSPNIVTGGQNCNTSGGGSWEHRVMYTFDREGIAREWVYSGSWGNRRSRDPKPSPAEPSLPAKAE